MNPAELTRLLFDELTKQIGPANFIYVANPVDLDDFTVVTLEGTFDLTAVAVSIGATLKKGRDS